MSSQPASLKLQPTRASTPYPLILSTATAVPEHLITRDDVKYYMGRVFDIPERKLEAMMSIVDNAQVHKRHSIFPITYTVEPRALQRPIRNTSNTRSSSAAKPPRKLSNARIFAPTKST